MSTHEQATKALERLTSIKIPGKDAHAIWRGTEHVGMVFPAEKGAAGPPWIADFSSRCVISPPMSTVRETLAWCEGYDEGFQHDKTKV